MDWKWCLKLFHVLLVLEMSENSLNKKILKKKRKKELSGNKLNDYEEMGQNGLLPFSGKLINLLPFFPN